MTIQSLYSSNKASAESNGGKTGHGSSSSSDVALTILEAASVPVLSQMQGQSLLRIAKSNPTADQAVYSRSDFSRSAALDGARYSRGVPKYLYVRTENLNCMTATDAAATKISLRHLKAPSIRSLRNLMASISVSRRDQKLPS
jgi:hypothetical protein